MKALARKNTREEEWGSIVRDVGIFPSLVPDLFGDDCTVPDIEEYFFREGAKANFRRDMQEYELVKVKLIKEEFKINRT